MTKFDISLNNFRAEGGKALAAGLTGDQPGDQGAQHQRQLPT
jgi:hypothetical protein